MYLHDAVLNKKFNPDLVEYTGVIVNVLGNNDLYKKYIIKSNDETTTEGEDYKGKTQFFNKIIDYRKEITSPCYMFKQLIPYCK